MKKLFFLFAVLFSVPVGGVANAGNEFLPGIYHILFGGGADDCNGDAGGTAALDSCGICAGGNTGRVSVCRLLHDTGLTWGGNYPSGNNDDCTGDTIAAQDCSHGADADVTLNDDSDGHAGSASPRLPTVVRSCQPAPPSAAGRMTGPVTVITLPA